MIGWDNLLKARSSVFVMEEEYRIEKGKTTESPPTKTTVTTNGVNISDRDGDKSTSSSLDPIPPSPTSPRVPSEIGLPPSSAEEPTSETRSMFHSKRLCERWLDNLFMVLYEVPPLFLANVDCRIYECIPCGVRNGNIIPASNCNSKNRIMNGRCWGN